MSIVLPVAGTEETYTVKPGKIIALGLNYRDHIAESPSVHLRGSSKEIPEEPIVFSKTPNVLIGPGEAIRIPGNLVEYSWNADARTDYEGELAFFIGQGGKNIPEERAGDHISGFTCMNDVSQRNIQTGDPSGWFRGKSFDTFGPVGPVVVRPRDIDDPQDLHIETRLNGKVVQESNTRHMIFSIPVIISYISRQFTLEEGDLLLTGTPSGVGPLTHGDTVEVEIQGIGVLSNPVIDERKGTADVD